MKFIDHSSFILLLFPIFVSAQSIGPAGVNSGGGSGSGSGHLSWSIGQISGHSFDDGNTLITAGIQQPDLVLLSINIKAFLDGPFVHSAALMNDGLRTSGSIPSSEPYSSLGFAHAGIGGGEVMAPGVTDIAGPDAIVDWVLVELREAIDPAQVVSTRSALVQRDGDVVDVDGISPLRMSAIGGDYHIAVRHRNHLPVLTALPLSLGQAPVPVDLTNGNIATYGTDAQRTNGGVHRLWAGDVNADHDVMYVGTGNDRDLVLQAIGGSIPTAVVPGYLGTDVNMDGITKYSGQQNDRDPILITIGGTVPTTVRNAQFP